MPRLLGEILVRAKAVNTRQLEEAMSNQVVFGGRLGTNLMDMGYITETVLASHLSSQSGAPTIEPQAYVKIHKSIAKAIPKAIAERTLSVPLVIKEKILHVVMADPNDFAKQDEIRFASGCKLKIYVAPEVRIYYLLHLLYGTKRDIRYVTLSRTDQMALRGPGAGQIGTQSAAPAKAKVLTAGGVEDASQSGDLMSEDEFARMTQDVGMGGATQDHEMVLLEEGEDDVLLGDVAEDENEILLLDEEIPVAPVAVQAPPAAASLASTLAATQPIAPAQATPPPPVEKSEYVPVRKLTLAQASKALQHVEDRDQIARVVLGFASGTFKRVALFMVRPDMVLGWDGVGEKMTRDTIERLMIPLNVPSVFKLVFDMQAHFLGAIPKSPVNNRFLKTLGGEQPRSAFIIPILFKGKVVNILYGDNGPGTDASYDIGELLILAMKIPQSFEGLLLRRKTPPPQA